MSGIHVEGLDRWVPLDLATTELDAPLRAAELAARFPATPEAGVVADGLVGTSLRLLREAAGDERTRLLAAWVLTETGEVLTPVAVATMRAVLVDPGTGPGDLLAGMLEGVEQHAAARTEEVSTASGPALAWATRLVRRHEDASVVQEESGVVWDRSDDGYAVLLTTQVLDLAAGHEVPERLVQLAQGVSGL